MSYRTWAEIPREEQDVIVKAAILCDAAPALLAAARRALSALSEDVGQISCRWCKAQSDWAWDSENKGAIIHTETYPVRMLKEAIDKATHGEET
jgi:hypothetical protein